MVRFEEIAAGDQLPRCERLVTREDVRAYAVAGGDPNPLHLDDAAARAAGFDGIIAHGMFTMGHLAQCLVDWLGDPAPIVRLKAAFRAPVFMGETIVAGGQVRSLDPSTRSVSLELWVTVERDGAIEHPIRKAEADLRFPPTLTEGPTDGAPRAALRKALRKALRAVPTHARDGRDGVAHPLDHDLDVVAVALVDPHREAVHLLGEDLGDLGHRLDGRLGLAVELLGHRAQLRVDVGREARLELLHRAERLPRGVGLALGLGAHQVLRDHAVVRAQHLGERHDLLVDVRRHPLLHAGRRLLERAPHGLDRVQGGRHPLQCLVERRGDRDVGGLGRSPGDGLGEARHLLLDQRCDPALLRLGRPVDVALEGLRVRSHQLGEAVHAGLQGVLEPREGSRPLPLLDPDALAGEPELLGEAADLPVEHLAELGRDVLVVDREGLGVPLHALGEQPHGLGAALHVALHRLDDAGRLAGDQLAVLLDPHLDRLDQGLVALVEVLEGRGDVPLDQLELVADRLDAVDRGRLRDLADRVDALLHRLARGARGLVDPREDVLEAGGADRERLEPLVRGGDQAADRLVAREERDDALLDLGGVAARGAPHLRGDLAHEGGRLLLDRPEPLLQALFDRPLHRKDHDGLLLRRWFGVGWNRPTREPGATTRALRRVGRTGLLHHELAFRGRRGAFHGSVGQARGRNTQAGQENRRFLRSFGAPSEAPYTGSVRRHPDSPG
ncbi:MAG: MaoC family dehydratase N-terminal domain-containing protein [Actinobacteria bacterium]|nr:MaoC family dehydratase N-terminal domain-containing protein [Actinomycetota bacterium]